MTNQSDPRRPEVALDGRSLTIRELVQIVRGGAAVRVEPEVLERARAANVAVVELARRRPIYGQSTGVGSNRDAGVTEAEAAAHGLGLLRSHATTAGPAMEPGLARAMMAVRLNQLAAGGSGVRPEVLEHLARALGSGLTPPALRYSAIGTADLGALATLALCLAGERDWLGGSLAPVTLENSDALAFISSNAATLGEAALAAHDLTAQLRATLVVGALSYVAMGGSAEAYAAQVHEARPHPGQQEAAARLRELIPRGLKPRRVQDPFSLRALPQVHGPAADALSRLADTITTEINSAGENPLVSPAAADIFHNGNFHSAYLALALDGARAAVYQVAALSAARLASLMEPATTGLRPFLATGPGASSGALMLEYVAHSALADLRHKAGPVNLGGAVLSRGAEEHAGFATQAAWRTTESAPVYELILACELVAAVRALRQQKTKLPDGPLADALRQASSALSADHADRPLDGDIQTAADVLEAL